MSIRHLTWTMHNADDAMLLTSDPDLSDSILRQFETEANTMGLHTLWAKTKLQNVAYALPYQLTSMGNTQKPYQVLPTWVPICHPIVGYSTSDIHRRIGLAYSNMGKLDRVWNNSRLSLATKLRINNCCILAVFLYGSETWTLLKTLHTGHILD